MNSKKMVGVLAVLGMLLGILLPANSYAASVPKADINVQKSGSITLHAVRNNASTAPINEINNGGVQQKLSPLIAPMPGVTFKYAAISRDEAKKLGWSPDQTKNGQGISREEALTYLKQNTTAAKETAKTGADGTVKITIDTIDTNHLEDNLYLIVEDSDPVPSGMVGHPDPLIINVPSLNPNYDGDKDKAYYNYDIHAYPKFVLDATGFKFIKVGEKDAAGKNPLLEGARFAIKDSHGNYLSKDPETGFPLVENSLPVFGTTEQKDAYVVTSNKNGVQFLGLPAGTYTVEEMKEQPVTGALGAYLPNGNAVTFTITPADVATNTVVQPLKDHNDQYVNYKKPTIEKEINQNSHDQFASVTYKLTMNIPADIGNYLTYAVKDNLSSKLDYLNYKIPAVKGISLTTADFSFKETDRPLVWNFNEAGRKKLQEMYDAGARTFTIELQAKPNTTAIIDTPTENDGGIDFDNGYAPEGTVETNKVYTIFGGVKFKKVDDLNGAALAGAKFVVRRTQQGKTTYLQQTGTKNEWVTDQKAATEFTSDANGAFAVNGLAYTHKVTFDKDGNATVDTKTVINNYQLVEVAAPKGYALLTDPLDFTIGKDTATKEIDVPNAAESKFPMTGGTASALLTIGGILLLLGGFFVYRRQETN